MMASNAPIAGAMPPDNAPRRDPAAVPALSIAGVSHSYGPRRALIDVSFDEGTARLEVTVKYRPAGSPDSRVAKFQRTGQ